LFFLLQSEEEVTRLQKELANLEDELDTSETKLSKMTARLSEAEKQADESERARRVLENRGQTDDDRLSKLQAEYNDVLSKNQEVEERYAQVSCCVLFLEIVYIYMYIHFFNICFQIRCNTPLH